MSPAISMENIREAMRVIKLSNECPVCKTQRDAYVVAGYTNFYCKHIADELAQTERATEAMKAAWAFFDYAARGEIGPITEIYGVKIVRSDIG